MAEEIKNKVDEEIVENADESTVSADIETSEKSEEKTSNKTDGEKVSGKTFTQEQVSKMMTREKNQGRSAAYKELGIDPKDTKMVNMFKAFVESQKTDDQKAAEKESENQTKMNEAMQRAQVAEAKAEAMMLGVKTQYVDDIVTLALAKMTEDSDLKSIIGEFKTKYAAWFDVSEGNEDKGKKVGQKGTGSSVKSDKENKGEQNKGIGARLAAQRKNSNKKSSYWGNNK